MFKDAKIYIAGHTGLLGSTVLKRLRSKGYSNIVTAAQRELDLTDQKAVDKFFAMENPEYVFLCAGLSGGILWNKANPATFLHTNLIIQDNVFESAQKYAVKHLIFYGASCVYPKHYLEPIKEEYLLNGMVEETSEAYAIAKIAGIKACKAYNSEYKTNRFIALIPATIYGPEDGINGEDSHVISALIKKFHDAKINRRNRVVLWGTGTPKREFIYCEDIAEASIFAMVNADKLQNMHYNIGTGIDYSIKELAEMVAGIAGFDGGIEWDRDKPDGTPRKLLDSSKFLSLGWRPETSLHDGLVKSYHGCSTNGTLG